MIILMSNFRSRESLQLLQDQLWWNIVECLVPLPLWCVQRAQGVCIMAWWQDCNDKWASHLFVSVFMTQWSNSTPEDLRVNIRLMVWIETEMIVVTLNLHSALFFSDANIVTRLMAGCTTGAMAVAFAQPTDVVKVRFQAQVRQSDGLKRYNGTMDAYRTIARDEGVRGLWKGEREFLKRDSSPPKKSIIIYSNSFHSKHVWLYLFFFF